MESVKKLNIDMISLMLVLPTDIQEWVTLSNLEDPRTIPESSRTVSLLKSIYNMIESNPGMTSPDYKTIYSKLPEYQAILLSILIGEDEVPSGSMDSKLFLIMISPLAGSWFTPIMITKPDRMSKEQMILILNICASFCANHERSGEEFDKVIIPLPLWTTHVCNELIKPMYLE